MTEAVYAYWTRPSRRPLRPGAAAFSALDLLVTAVSVLLWRRANGPARLYTDKAGLEYFDHVGLAGLWSSIDTAVLEAIPQAIDAAVFWDIGKVFALEHHGCPAAVLDLDLIVWAEVERLRCADVQFLHWEELVEPWYVSPERLHRPPGYRFAPGLDWNMWACNTALMYVRDERFREAYCCECRAFAAGNRPPDGWGLAEFLFCGQRLYGMTARRLRVEARPFIEYCHVPCGRSRWLVTPPPHDDPLSPLAFRERFPFTHLWASKHRFREDPAAARRYGQLLARRCLEVDPECAGELTRVSAFGQFLGEPTRGARIPGEPWPRH